MVSVIKDVYVLYNESILSDVTLSISFVSKVKLDIGM